MPRLQAQHENGSKSTRRCLDLLHVDLRKDWQGILPFNLCMYVRRLGFTSLGSYGFRIFGFLGH